MEHVHVEAQPHSCHEQTKEKTERAQQWTTHTKTGLWEPEWFAWLSATWAHNDTTHTTEKTTNKGRTGNHEEKQKQKTETSTPN